ncbi:hypothetical protein Daesc_001416 [Daldinia eschscholtzii]|uniref:Heterokaryon incompatibility domain-containing protein n=1 Tax=Daldinia eschscholtzii TaxID=292717 RepID=A0AAX6MUG5_9PEZI
MSSTLCKDCSSIPWAELHSQGDLGEAAKPFSYHPSPASYTARDACSICRIIFPEDLESSSQCVTVRVNPYHSVPDAIGVEEATGVASIIFERALQDRYKLVIAEFNVYISQDSKYSSLISRDRHLLKMVVSAVDVACSVSPSQVLQPGLVAANPPTSKLLDLPLSWMKQCMQTHESCKPANAVDAPLPTRLLHIGSKEGDPIRLHDTSECYGRYVALSHRWGSERTFTTSQETLSSRRQGIPFCELPQTFQDAITVSRALGLDYIWIDSLCIIQDDPEEWRSESLRMKDVYSNATLVISASRSTSDLTGFLSPRKTGEIITIANHEIGKSSTIHIQQVINSLTPYDDSLRTEPLHKRSWALQERYLATRILFFASHQMFWECKTLSLAEDGRRLETPRHRVDQLIPIKMDTAKNWMSEEEFKSHKSWYSMVERFMFCGITYHSDRLPALSGLAQSLSLKTGDIYLAESCDIEADGNQFGIVKGGHISLRAPMFPVYTRKGPFDLDYFPELTFSREGVYMKSFGPFQRIFDVMFGFRYGEHVLFLSGSLDFPEDHPENTDLYIIFLAGETRPSPDRGWENAPSNEGYFGLLIQKSTEGSHLYTRVGAVHGRLVAEDEGIQAGELFEKYRLWRKNDYLYGLDERETRPEWFRVPLNEQEKEFVTLV